MKQVQRTRFQWSGPSEHSVLCSKHFANSCFEPESALWSKMGKRISAYCTKHLNIGTVHLLVLLYTHVHVYVMCTNIRPLIFARSLVTNVAHCPWVNNTAINWLSYISSGVEFRTCYHSSINPCLCLQLSKMHVHQFHLFLFLQVIQIVSIPVIVLKIKTWNFLYCLWYLLTSHSFSMHYLCWWWWSLFYHFWCKMSVVTG